MNELHEINYFNQSSEEDLRERFEVLKRQESMYKSRDYLGGRSKELSNNDNKLVGKICRFKMCTWCFEVQKYFDFNQETVSMAISYLDKFLSSNQGYYVLRHKEYFQLAVICCLNIAIKSNESKIIEIDYLIQLSNEIYSKKQIFIMEEEIVFALKWRLCPPTTYVFVDFILNHIIPYLTSNTINEEIKSKTRKQIFLAAPVYAFSTIDPSLIALAAIFNALEELEGPPRYFYLKFYANLQNITGLDASEYKDHFFLSIRNGLSNLIDDNPRSSDKNKIIISNVDAERKYCISGTSSRRQYIFTMTNNCFLLS